jgi:uncharacterized protein (TIGR03437 family)
MFSRFGCLLCLAGIALFGQALSVSVQQLSLRMPEGGPLPPVTRFTVTSGRPWQAKLSNPDLMGLNPAQGTGSGTVIATPADYLKVGTYSGTITISDDQSASTTIALTISVVPRANPKLTYPTGAAGPAGCADVPGLPPGNAALCAVPNENPPGNFAPPSAGQSYADPNFGGRVRVIAGPDSMHGYSTPSPVSASNRYALVSINGEPAVVELLTGKLIKKIPFGFEGAMWDGRNDNYMYYLSGATVRRYDIGAGVSTTVADYSSGPIRFQSITSGGTGEITRDNWLSFYAPQERQLCALDISASRTYCGAVPAGINVDFPTMSKGIDKGSGLRYVVAVVGSGPFLIYSVNQTAGRLDVVGRGPENILYTGGNRDGVCDAGEPCVNGSHSDIMEDSAGNQLLMTALEGDRSPCEYSYYSIQLNKGAQMGLPFELGGGLKRVMPLFRCGGSDIWVDFHTGCAKAAPMCVLSTRTQAEGQAKNPTDKTPLKRTAYVGEIMILRDNGAETRRLAEHRSVLFSNEDASGYWSTPRGAISADGAYVVATTNFGFPNQHRVIVVDTGLAQARLADGNPLVNAASYDSKAAPGVLVTAFGSNLTHCDVALASFPLPTELCGTSVTVGDASARMVSVLPGQVSFFVPQNAPAGGPSTLSVQSTSIYGDVSMATATLPAGTVAAAAPAMFTPLPVKDHVLMLDLSGSPSPVKLGEIGTVFAVGLGPTNPPVAEGQPGPLNEPLARVTNLTEVYINDVRQTVLYAGLIPGLWGIYQINFQVNAATTLRSDNNWIWLNSAGVESPRLIIDLLPQA